MTNLTTVSQSKWTDENILDLIRKLRNDLIKDFLDERFLKQYVDKQMGVKELTAVKSEFIKAHLKEMLISPIDIMHYRAIITQIKDTDTASISDKNEKLFYDEIERSLKIYLYS